jgi:hypothetical protein
MASAVAAIRWSRSITVARTSKSSPAIAPAAAWINPDVDGPSTVVAKVDASARAPMIEIAKTIPPTV